VKTPRDREGSFEPKLVAKRQTRLAGLDERILNFYAGGMSVRDIAQHLSDLYGREIGRDTISRVTDAVLEDLEAWRTTPLEAVYPIVYFDCLIVKVREDRRVRSRACYLAVGVTVDRPASSTRSERRCATSPTRTARPSHATSSPSTGPSTQTPPGRRSRRSMSSGASATR
jgi:Transposase, Mutator family